MFSIFINRINCEFFFNENELDSNFTLPLITVIVGNHQHVEKRAIEFTNTITSNEIRNINETGINGDGGVVIMKNNNNNTNVSTTATIITGGDDEYTILNIGVLMASHLGGCYQFNFTFISFIYNYNFKFIVYMFVPETEIS